VPRGGIERGRDISASEGLTPSSVVNTSQGRTFALAPWCPMVNRSTMVRISKHVLVGGLLAALTLPPGSTEAATPQRDDQQRLDLVEFRPGDSETAVDLGVPDKCPPVVCDNYDLTVELPLPAAIFYQTMTARMTSSTRGRAYCPPTSTSSPSARMATAMGRVAQHDSTDGRRGPYDRRSGPGGLAHRSVASRPCSPPPPTSWQRWRSRRGHPRLHRHAPPAGVPEPSVGRYPTSVTAGDFNGDGNLDLAVINLGSYNVSVLLGNGDGTFRAAANYDVGFFPHSVTSGDFNGDGKPDLAVANQGSNNVSVLLATATAPSRPPSVTPPAPTRSR